MEAKELRIGNLVYYQGSLVEIYTISPSRFFSKMGNGQKEYSEAKPIPLTEEWLVSFGVFKVYEDQGIWQLGVITFILNSEGLFLTDGKEPYQGASPLKHVHQLQNLYFALTGEELTLLTNEIQR